LISTGTDATFRVRGVSPNVLQIRTFVKVSQGRMFQPGLSELVVGKNASKTYSGLTVGNTINFGGGHWQVVGVFDAGGSAFDSEIWCDAKSSTKSCCALPTFSVRHRPPRFARVLPGVQGFCYLQPATQRDAIRRG